MRGLCGRLSATRRRRCGGRAALPSRLAKSLFRRSRVLTFDVPATALLILAHLASGQSGTVPLQTYSTAPPQSATAERRQSGNAVESSSSAGFPGGLTAPQPIVLRHEPSGTAFALDAALLQRIMPGGDPGFLNEEALRFVVEGWANQVSYPAQDARLRFDEATSALTVLQHSRAGQRLNVDLTVEAVRKALATNQRTGTLPIISIPPAVDSGRLNELGIRELVASGTTYFAGSSRTRVYNIEVASEKLVGVVVPPGGVFSFNSAIEAVSGANRIRRLGHYLGGPYGCWRGWRGLPGEHNGFSGGAGRGFSFSRAPQSWLRRQLVRRARL